MPNKKKVLFLVPDGVGIKNYLYSNIIKYLKEHAEITIWSPLPVEAFEDVKQIHNIDFRYKYLELIPESSFTRLYREATTFARLKYYSRLQNNPTILTNWRKPNYSFKVRLLYRLAEILGSYLGNKYQRILKFEKKGLNNIPEGLIQNYYNDLEEFGPDSIFITHQRVAGLMPICLAAEKLKIKTTTAIFSWDNLPKARLAVKANSYLVWSEWMKQEIKDYYPEIDLANVKLVGTSQFEFYLDRQRVLDRESFANRHGLDPNKNWICFSGDDITTSPYDHLFLKDVAETLASQKDKLQIIFRRCPVDFSSRYDEVINDNKDFIIPLDPLWNIQSKTGWVGYFPKYEDISMQINLAYHCKMVINLGSTMAIDFATFNKPCLYLKYNPSTDENWSTDVIYNFQHFRSMGELNAVGWIESKEAIQNRVLETLENPLIVAPDIKKWMQTIVKHPIDENSKDIAKELL